MAKSTEIELKPDDPIFSGGSRVFAPISRPSTSSSRRKQTPSINPMSQAAEALERTGSKLISNTAKRLKAQSRSEASTTPRTKESL